MCFIVITLSHIDILWGTLLLSSPPHLLLDPQVIPFAADCDLDECTCRDPKAEENQ